MTKNSEPKEFSEKTVEKAIEAACTYFNCPRENLKIDIITRGSTGLFGLGGRKARITARPLEEEQETTARAKTEEPPPEEDVIQRSVPQEEREEPSGESAKEHQKDTAESE
ncbi:MAG: hypothetical protein DSZ23_00755, partial [Thermodesulfatator sp.]